MSNFTRHIIPFTFEQYTSYRALVKRLTAHEKWEKGDIHGGEQDLYAYVTDTLDEPFDAEAEDGFGASNNGSFWILNAAMKKKLPKLVWTGNRGNREVPFAIRDAGLYLFHTGMGFFWYEFEIAIGDEDDLINFHYYFKELAWKRNNERFRLQGEANAETYFCLGDWAASVIDDAIGTVAYYPSRSNPMKKNETDGKCRFIPDKAVMFHFNTAENRDSEKMKELAWYLTNGFKKSYQMPENIGDTMHRPFENMYWYVTSAGCGQFSSYDDSNRQFFLQNTPQRMRTIYFMLYILLLQQKYSLLHYAELLEQDFSSDAAPYYGGVGEIYDKLQDYEIRINVFLMKNTHSSVSHQGIHNDFYKYAEERMQLRKDIESLTTGMESLNRLTGIRANETEKERDGKMQSALTILSVLAVFSALVDCYGFIKEIPAGYKDFNPVKLGISLLFYAGIIAVVLYVIVIAGKTKKK